MAYQVRDLTVEQTASFLGVSPATVGRRAKAGELRLVRSSSGGRLIRFAPYDDWLRADDAAGLLGVSSATVRLRVQRGQLAGQRVEGRWRVLLASVLDQPRVNPETLALFTGEQPPEAVPEPDRRPPGRFTKGMHVRLDEDTITLLEAARARHGTYAAAVDAALRREADEPVDVDEIAGIRVDLETTRGALERSRAQERDLRDRYRARPVDELYCPACERLVPIEEVTVVEVGDGLQELHHGAHEPRQASKLRRGTVAARRRAET